MLKFGDTPWMDAPYNVHLSNGLIILPEIEEGNGFAARVRKRGGSVKAVIFIDIPDEHLDGIDSPLENMYANVTLDFDENVIYTCGKVKEIGIQKENSKEE